MPVPWWWWISPGHGDADGGGVRLGRCEHEALACWLESSGSRWHAWPGCLMGAGVALAFGGPSRVCGWSHGTRGRRPRGGLGGGSSDKKVSRGTSW